MDIISFNEAATANGRIEKFIENPDSNSGIVTVPKVIGAGENITIPSGRMAVLPNVQVDGTLNVEGEVFIPNGAGLSTVVQKSGDTMTGSLTTPSLISTGALYSNDGTTTTRVISSGGVSYIGTITNHPLVLQTGNTERMRIDTAGVARFSSEVVSKGWVTQNTPGTSNILIRNLYDHNRIDSYNDPITGAYPLIINSSELLLQIGDSTTLVVDTNKNVLVSRGGLGYGSGAGGTVTQLTSRSTSVTIDKPVGNITLFTKAGAALEFFQVFNNKVSSNDTIQCSVKLGAVNAYSTYVFNVTNGSFCIAVSTNGTNIDTPIINFSIIKGANS